MNLHYPRAVLAALRGGSGKTTLSLGMIAAYKKLGRRVVPFKKGPDFIDAGWLAYAAARPCYNLDSFLVETKKTLDSFLTHAEPEGLAIIEGNRGLFDGMDAHGTHSTAELAKLIQAPVLLIADCTKSTRTVAAMVLGCLHLDSSVKIGGVILNMVGTARHERLVRNTVEEYCGVPVLGALPRVRDNSLPERHMGLVPPQEHPEADRSIEAARELVERCVDLERVWETAASAGPLKHSASRATNGPSPTSESPVIGVVRDSSFWFYYPENIEDLVKSGATIVEVNSLRDRELPELDALYIGGGFPETHAAELAANESFRTSLRRAIDNGLPVYAECGGLMYLGRSLILNDSEYPMVGTFPVSFTVEKRPQGHGYTLLEVDGVNPYFADGAALRGHEFHYSKPVALDMEQIVTVFANKRGSGFYNHRDGLVKKNTLATYSHLHSSGEGGWAGALVNQALSYRIFRRRSFALGNRETPGFGVNLLRPAEISGLQH